MGRSARRCREFRSVLWAAAILIGLRGLACAQATLTFEAEDWTTPKDAWQENKTSENKWNLWSTDSHAMEKWSKGVVLQSPPVLKDRATPEEGAPPLHTRITGIPAGKYDVEVKLGRALAVSFDGKTWQRKDGADNSLGSVEIKDGVLDLWVDDRYADAASPGAAYYDCLFFFPSRPRAEKPKVEGFARERVRETIDRGLVALPTGSNRVYLGWRLLASDPPDVVFNVYRSANGQPPTKLNPAPIRETTDFTDAAAPPNGQCEYTVRPVGKEGEGAPSPAVRVTASAEAQDCILVKLDEGETFQKVGIGDLDGDGRYDLVLKQPQDNIDPAASYWTPSPNTYKVEAYSHDGRRLWRKDLGWSIERGIWYSPMIVFDLDGDGKAEVALKTGEGDPRGADGRVETGPEYLSILDGLTGQERARVDWPSRQAPDELYNYNLSSRNQICVAYLDGKTPCLIVERGTYTVIRLVAYEFHDGKLRKLWDWDNREDGRKYRAQGAHIMHAADVDGDGRDEVIIGSAVVDDNGVGLWSTGFGHPDFCFVGDIDPRRPGLEIFYGIEPHHKDNGLCLVDAKTGEVIWGLKKSTNHVGSDGMCADIDMQYPGSECYAVDLDKDRKYAQSWLFSAGGEMLTDKRQPTMSKPVHWDADPQREQVRGAMICDFQGGVHPPKLVGSYVTVADILGDWREEIITCAPGELRIYTTTIPARDRRVCLMQDPIYRIDVAVAFMGYWAAPMLSYDVAWGCPGMALRVPAGLLTPGGATEGKIVLQAAGDAPLRGALTLEADPRVTLSPTKADVDVATGKSADVPFTITVPAQAAVPEGQQSVPVSARLDMGARSLRSDTALRIADAPATAGVKVEAEEIAAQGGGEVKIRNDKVGASGKAISHWDHRGHWMEWKASVPQRGRYRVAVRYCTPGDVVRELKLDGATPPGLAQVMFPATGGFGGETNDWAHAFVRDAKGQPVEWDLEAGPHTVRMTNVDEKGMNLDYLLLVPKE